MSHERTQPREEAQREGPGGWLGLAMHAALATVVCSTTLLAAQFCQTAEAAADAQRSAIAEWAMGSIDRAVFAETYSQYCNRAVVVTTNEWLATMADAEVATMPMMTARECLARLAEDPNRRGALSPDEVLSLRSAIDAAKVDQPAPLRWL